MTIKHFNSLFLLLVTMPALSAQQGSSQPVRSNPITETSRPATMFQAEFPYDISLKDANGELIHSAALFKREDKPMVLLFWLTTCGPCRQELSAIAQKFEAWQQEADFNFYAISTDFPNRADQFYSRVRESNWPFPAYYDFNREFRLVMPGELNGLPQVFVLDKDGKIQYHKRKYLPGDEDQLLEAIKSL